MLIDGYKSVLAPVFPCQVDCQCVTTHCLIGVEAVYSLVEQEREVLEPWIDNDLWRDWFGRIVCAGVFLAQTQRQHPDVF